MRRRDFIMLVGGAVAGWPLGARAQQGRQRKIGFLCLKSNPLGMFAPTNPDVSCEGYNFALLEKPTKMMPGP